MNAKLVVAAVVIAVLGYCIWKKHVANVEAAALATLTDPYGFVELQQPEGVDPQKVFIFAPANCPREAGQRSDALAESLKEQDVAFVRRSSISYRPMDEVMLRRVNGVLEGDNAPIVFINGRIKANPDLDEVVAEYEAAQR